MDTAVQSDQQRNGLAGLYRRRELISVLVLFFAVNVSNYADRYALAVLAPLIRQDLAISDSQLGILTGFGFALFYAICGVPLGRLADRSNRRNLISYALTTWSVITALSGLAQSYWHLLMARMGVGIGEAGSGPASHSMICDFFPLDRRPVAFSILGLGAFTGMATGFGLGGWLGEAIGWRWAFVALGAPGLLLAVIVRIALREPVRGHFEHVAEADSTNTLPSVLVSLFRCPSYRLIVVVAILNGCAMSGFGQWWPSFFNRSHGMSPSTSGLYLGVLVGLGSAAGVLIGGMLANRMAPRRQSALIWIPLVAIGLAAPAALASLLASSAQVSIACVLLVNFFWSIPNGAMTTAIYAVSPPQSRATAGAVWFFLVAVLGLGLGPVLVGFASDLLMAYSGNESLRFALLVPTLALVLMIPLLARLTRTFPRDVDRHR